MREIFDNLMKSVYTAIPATVINVHEGSMFVDVMPVIVENNQRINEVPLVFPQSKKYGLRFRVEEGDEVLLITSKYPLDNYFTRKEEIRVGAGRGKQFQYGECFAIPCINMFSGDLAEDVQCEIVSEKSKIKMTDKKLEISAGCLTKITTTENIEISSTADINIEATKNIKIKSAKNVEILAAKNVDLAAMTVNIKAPTVNIDSPFIDVTGNLMVKGSVTALGGAIAPNIPT